MRNWTIDSVTKRIGAVAAVALMLTFSLPLLTDNVHGQPNTQLEYEVQDLRAQVQKLNSIPTDVALILAHQKVEDERYKEQQEFQSKIVWGFIGMIGSVGMALLIWAMNQFGIIIGPKPEGSSPKIFTPRR